jgi:hypothetical protein
MSNLPTHLSSALDPFTTRASLSRQQVPTRIERAIRHETAVEHGRGIVQAARVRAVEHVAHEALSATSHLSQLEALYTRQAPHAAGRLQAIADMAALSMADIVAETGR